MPRTRQLPKTRQRPRSLQRTAACAAAAAACVGLAACSDDDQPAHSPASPVAQASGTHQSSTTKLDAAQCAAMPPSGPILRSGYELNYSAGSIKVALTQEGRPDRCVEFEKSGRADAYVPPDTLLFTFAGGRGEGAQLEFRAVDLAGGILPWPAGASVQPQGAPITATVGVSLDGEYFTSSACVLTLTTVNDSLAAGRFNCPAATAQAANPLNPNDDVSHDEPSTPEVAPPTAAVSGLFTVSK